jgi:hypothetical protein
MKVYLAAPYAARPQVADYAAQLTRIGFTVTSRWLTETHELNAGSLDAAPGIDDDTISRAAYDDLYDVDKSELFVLLTEEAVGVGSKSGGRHVETGYFMAKRGARFVIVVGDPENIFHRMADVTCVPDWHEAVVELSRRLVAVERSLPQELVR